MRQIFSIILCLTFGVINGQDLLNFPFTEVPEPQNKLEFNADFDYSSNAIDNYLVDRFIAGGLIDYDRLEEMNSKMDGSNSFGGDFDLGLRYRAVPDSINWKPGRTLFLEFGNAGYGFIEFPEDLFELTFMGNSNEVGNTMNLGQSRAQAMNYQYAGLGLMNESTGSYISFNIINVQNYFSSEIYQFDLYTSENAFDIEIDYNGEVVLSDSLRGDFLSNSGTGAVLNGRYNFKLPKSENLLSFEVKNLGVAVLNNPTRTLRADSTFSFSGIDLNQVLDSENPLTTVSLEDSLSWTESSGNEMLEMPTVLKSEYYHKLNDLDYMMISAQKTFFTRQRAVFELSYLHKETERISYNLGFAVGGYGGPRMSAGFTYKSKNWLLHLRTRHLVGAFLNSANGRSLSFGVSRNFNQN